MPYDTLFCNVCVCICVGFVMCVFVWVFWCVFCTLTEVFLTLTEVYSCFFLSCKTNARVKLAKKGHGPHSSTLFVICVVLLLYLLFCVLFVCKCGLPLGDNPIALNKYIISYHIISYLILYNIISYFASALKTNDSLPATNYPDNNHNQRRLFSYRIVRPVNLLSDRFPYTFDIHMSEHRNIIPNYSQQDATFHNLFVSYKRSTCFRRFLRPSSGAQFHLFHSSS